jgi:hypothetical protein
MQGCGSFASGTMVSLDTKTGKGTVKWGPTNYIINSTEELIACLVFIIVYTRLNDTYCGLQQILLVTCSYDY